MTQIRHNNNGIDDGDGDGGGGDGSSVQSSIKAICLLTIETVDPHGGHTKKNAHKLAQFDTYRERENVIRMNVIILL